jgi:hypothetical protein
MAAPAAGRFSDIAASPRAMDVERRTILRLAVVSAGRAALGRIAPQLDVDSRVARRNDVDSRIAPFLPASARVPVEVLIIRHAEQPGRGSQLHLSDLGRARAAALPKLFPTPFATPAFLFAARPSKESDRSVETLQPLAAALRLGIDDRFPDDAYAQLASTILTSGSYAGAHVLICWHHGMIPALAAALGAAHAPARWPETQYDHVWQLRYARDAVTFDDRFAPLLPSDRQT